MKKRKIVGLVCTCAVIGLCCVGCSSDTKKAENHAEKIVDLMEEKNIEEMNRIILGYEDPEMHEETSEENENASETDGIITEIMKKDKIKVKDVDKSQIIYEIESPNLNGILDDLKNSPQLSEDDILNHCKDYISKAEMTKYTVKIPYSVVDEEIEVNYRNRDFINAITGGLLEVYQKAYQDMITEYGIMQ